MEPTAPGASRVLLQVRVGAFIVAGLLVLVGLIYFLGRQSGMFERQYRLVARFTQIGGLIEGATVRLAGVPVGRVAAIRLPEAAGRKVHVELTLVRRVQSRVRGDSVARIETLGLLGDKIVEVSLGSPEAPALAEGAEVQTEEPFDTNRVMKQGTELLRNLVEISGELKAAIAVVTESAAGPDLVETVRAMRALATEIERGQGALHRLIYDRDLGRVVADAAGTLRQVSETARRLDRLLADPKTAGLVDAAHQAVAEARQAVAEAGGAMRQVTETARRADRLLADPKTAGLVDAAHQAVAEASRAMRQLSEAVQKAERLLADPRTAGLVDEARQAVAEARQAVAEAGGAMRQVTETARRADRLLADPKTTGLVDDAREAVGEARDAMARVNRLVREVEEGQGLLHSLVYGESRLVRELDRLLGRAGAVLAGVERGEGALGVLLRDADAARALRRVVTAADGLAQTVEQAREADGLLRALVFDPEGKALVADLRDTARHFREVTARVVRGEGLLGHLTRPGTEEAVKQLTQGLAGLGQLADDLAKDARLVEALTDLRAAMADLRTIAARVEAGEGTIGGLVQDPTVYENLAAFLEGAQRSLILRALIRSAIGRGGSER
jgi:phospholipid/cholesterol/gamma-HCH transport system substrate-binding protein